MFNQTIDEIRAGFDEVSTNDEKLFQNEERNNRKQFTVNKGKTPTGISEKEILICCFERLNTIVFWVRFWSILSIIGGVILFLLYGI